MTRGILFLTALFSVSISFGQTSICILDTSSAGAEILHRVRIEGYAAVSVSIKKTEKKYQGYRICENHYLQIDSLNQILTDPQIDSLITCDNGTLKTVGFILYAKRHNDKESVLGKLREILKQEYVFMTSSCSDALQFISLGQLNYNLLTKPNFLLKPNFKLSKEDKALIEVELANYENSFGTK